MVRLGVVAVLVACSLAVMLASHATTAVGAAPQQKIKHFVTVMLENRAFDHRLGLFKHPGMEGLPQGAQNMLNGTVCKVRTCCSNTAYDTAHDTAHEGNFFEGQCSAVLCACLPASLVPYLANPLLSIPSSNHPLP